MKKMLRSLWRAKFFTFLNLIGLTLGITGSMVIATYVMDEFSYDTQWENSENSYRITMSRAQAGDHQLRGGTVPASVGPLLKSNFPEVLDYSEIYPQHKNFIFDKSSEDTSIPLTVIQADTSVFKFLDIDLSQQATIGFSKDYAPIIISKSIQENYFKNENPVGKVIYELPKYSTESKAYQIVGVMEDLPSNTHLRGDLIQLNERKEAKDARAYARQYLQLENGVSPEEFENKVNFWLEEYAEAQDPVLKNVKIILQPMRDIYLHTDFSAYQFVRGNVSSLYILSGIGLLLFSIVCINYINLKMASAQAKIKDAGIHKIMGASFRQLILRSIKESALVFITATLASCVVYEITLPLLENFVGHPIRFRIYESPLLIVFLFLVLGFVSILCGVYPAWLTSKNKMTRSLKNQLHLAGSSMQWLRPGLVTFQFIICSVVLVGMLVVKNQNDLLKNKDLGFQPEHLIQIESVSWDGKASVLKNRLNENPFIESTSYTNWLPGTGAGEEIRTLENPLDPTQKIDLWFIRGEANLAQTLGLQLKTGRFLDDSRPGDVLGQEDYSSVAMPALVTETTMNLLQDLELEKAYEKGKIIPVGLLQDFNSESLHKNLVATVIMGFDNPQYGTLLIRSAPGKELDAMRGIEAIWKDIYPYKLLEMSLVKDQLALQYATESRLDILFKVFSSLSILLSILGLLGLIMHSLQLRIREIGIRKVLGASILQNGFELTKGYFLLITIGVMISYPIAWSLTNNWLENFAFRVELKWWMFALPSLLIFILTTLIIGYQVIKATLANPVDSLRNE